MPYKYKEIVFNRNLFRALKNEPRVLTSFIVGRFRCANIISFLSRSAAL